MPGTIVPAIPNPTRAAFLAMVAAAAPLAAQLPSGNWQYVWGDDFSGSTLDTSKWSHNYPWGTTHNHNATMRPANVRFGDGTLTLVAERTGGGSNDFRSGAVSTGYNSKRVNGGYIEARILLPDAPGSSDQIVSSQLEDRGDFEVREWIHTVPVEDASPKFMRLILTRP